jgi:hypothetical protein
MRMVLPVVELSIVRPMAGMPPQRLHDLTGTAVCGGGLPDLTFSLQWTTDKYKSVHSFQWRRDMIMAASRKG